MKHEVGKESKSIRSKNPDKGPPIMEGAHHFDKGYESDHETFTNEKLYPDNHQRGNAYFAMTNEAKAKDSTKLKRGHFTKMA